MKNKVFFILVYKCKMFVSIVEKIYNFLFILVTVRLIIFLVMIVIVIFLRKIKNVF